MFFKKHYLLNRPWVANYMNLFDETFFLNMYLFLAVPDFVV